MPRTIATFRLDSDLLDGLRQLYERDGVQVSESVRRAIGAWLEMKKIDVRKTDRKRAATRKRS